MGSALEKEIKSKFVGIEVFTPQKYRMTIKIRKENLLDVLKFLKDKEFNYLTAVTCVDWIDEDEFELIYHLSSFRVSTHIMIKKRIPRENPSFPSIIQIFKNSQTYEREIHELFGIYFEGNPRLTSLFLENWKDKPPFRKDFDTREYVKETYDSIPTLEEYK